MNLISIFNKTLSCIKERRLPWRISSALGIIDTSAESNDMMDDLAQDSILKLKPRTVVDLGAGSGKYGKMLRENLGGAVHVTGIEAFGKTVKHLKRKNYYNEIVHANAAFWLKDNRKRYDLAIFGDVLEHFNTERDALSALKEALAYCDYVIIVAPLGETVQGPQYGNPYQAHKVFIKEIMFDECNVVEKIIRQEEAPIPTRKIFLLIRGTSTR